MSNITPSDCDDDIDIDVCMGCGRYYGMTESLVNLWRSSPGYNPNTVMPQLCYRCMEGMCGV